MLSECVSQLPQKIYHEIIVSPWDKNKGENFSRICELEGKSGHAELVSVHGYQRYLEPILNRGGLNLREALELQYLLTLARVDSKYGRYFGNYKLKHFVAGTKGTQGNPYKVIWPLPIEHAAVDIITSAQKRKEGIFVGTSLNDHSRSIIHVSQNFELEALSGDQEVFNTEVSALQREMLKHPKLLRRSSKNNFKQTIRWYQNHAHAYAESISQALSKDQIDAFSLLLPPGSSVLDVGSNGGRDVDALSQRGFNVSGLDLVLESLRIAKGHNPKSTQINCDMMSIPFSRSSFDGLWVHASMHHLDGLADFKRGLSEFARIIRKGGIIHLATQAKTDRLRTAIVVDELAKSARQYLYVTKQELGNMLKQHGFKIINIAQHLESNDAGGTNRQAVEWIVALAQKT